MTDTPATVEAGHEPAAVGVRHRAGRRGNREERQRSLPEVTGW